MVVYKEISSLCHDLKYSAKALYYASNTIEKHYHKVEIPKGNGEIRVLNVPDKFLKSIQRSIARNILAYEEISPYATAYRVGGSTVKNARPHVGNRYVLKLDIKKFFDHITFPMVKDKVFIAGKYSEPIRILLTILCVYKHTVPQGAPTSPMISNIILRDFDNEVGMWCRERNITYTRYCDDMTFSGDFDSKEVIKFIKAALYKRGFFLNDKKKVLLNDGERKSITGIVVNEKVAVAASYKKNIRRELYYIKKYGIDNHISHSDIKLSRERYINNLIGRINYVLSVEAGNEAFRKYREELNYVLTDKGI